MKALTQNVRHDPITGTWYRNTLYEDGHWGVERISDIESKCSSMIRQAQNAPHPLIEKLAKKLTTTPKQTKNLLLLLEDV